MTTKLTEVEKLKYWLDSEITILHIMFAIILWCITESTLLHVALSIYILISVVYMCKRAFYLGRIDKDYLKLK